MSIGDDDIDVWSIDELDELPEYTHIAPGVDRYNTGDEREAYEVIHQASDDDARVTVAIHDEYSGEMYTLFSNDGHAPGMSADELLDRAGGDLEGYLTGIARDEGYIVQSVDFYQITEYE